MLVRNLKVFSNHVFEVGVVLEGDVVLFDVEQVAKCLGIVSKTTKNNIVYENVRWSRVNDYIGHLLPHVAEIQKGDLIPEPLVYKLAFKASNEVAEQFQDWLAIEVLPELRKTGQYNSSQKSSSKEQFDMHLLGVQYASEILRVDETSKIKMLEAVHKTHGVPTTHLPAYVEEEVTQSITVLLKEHGANLTAAKANTLLIQKGLLEIKERPSSKGGTKQFKSLTSLGLKYGKNLLNPKSPKETQPHFYASKFKELLTIIEGGNIS